ARRYPELQILAVHMGGVENNDISNAMIDIAADHANITLIGSNVKTLAVLKAIRELGAERVCFGSDTPFELMHVAAARYDAMLSDTVSDSERQLIMSGNIRRLFKLD
ncbi:MAG: amidohydrolase family protein, partial [Eubacteriales bacterium]|nr:amidohydrolase family protein [Eubacteriales bacterium]